jgi:hypothetical protein
LVLLMRRLVPSTLIRLVVLQSLAADRAQVGRSRLPSGAPTIF